jgi:hypothetical protein
MTQNIKKINLKIHKIEVKVKINSLLKLHPSMFYGIKLIYNRI